MKNNIQCHKDYVKFISRDQIHDNKNPKAILLVNVHHIVTIGISFNEINNL